MKTQLLVFMLCLGFLGKSIGQSKPQIQNASLRAPANIKVDGELKEWGDKKLAAYNVTNRIYYAVSNDDDNLYLTIVGAEVTSGFKILKEGVTFTVSHSLEKSKRSKDAQNVKLIFPMFPASQNGIAVSSMMVPIFNAATLAQDTIKNKKDIDSLTIIANKRVGQVASEIKITGIKQIMDSVLSVYNDSGIKAILHFAKGEPVIEMAIPLKYLNLSIYSTTPFSYNIKLEVPLLTGDNTIPLKSGDDASGVTGDMLYRLTATELWGEYTLVKKNR